MEDTRQRLTVTVSPAGEMSPIEWKKWFNNILSFTVPLYFGFFFASLAAGMSLKNAALTSLIALCGPLADYFKKKQGETITR